jgi:hypothetical protein
MKRTLLGFSVRCYSEVPLHEMAERVAAAVGCTFEEGEFREREGLVAKLLGMNVELYDWVGLADRVVFVFVGYVGDARFVRVLPREQRELVSVDISEAVADVLNVNEVVAEWTLPTEADYEAEREHSAQRSDRVRRQEEAEEARRSATRGAPGQR